MPMHENMTPYEAAETVGMDAQGREYYLCVVKATFNWDEHGKPTPAATHQPVTAADQFAPESDPPACTLESDLVPEKPQVDVLLAGSIKLPRAVPQVDVGLDVGQRIRKQVRVFGDRYWVRGAGGLVMTEPRPFDEMPIRWDRCFGGMDPQHPKHAELRNPAGVGMRKDASALEKQLVANFEDPRKPIHSYKEHPAPVGFGPMSRTDPARSKLAGTYDDAWQEEQAPLLPEDFNPLYYNCAPPDQRLDAYIPGEVVRLSYMTERGQEQFSLPDFTVEFARALVPERIIRRHARPDTIIIEPKERRFSLVARFVEYPQPDISTLGKVIVGPSSGRVRAIEKEKQYVDWRTGETRD